MKVLVIKPGKSPCCKEIDNSLESLQKAVGGYIEAIYPYDDPVALICDEEGKIKGKEFNRPISDDEGFVYDVIAGTFLVVGLSEDNFTSLSPELVIKYAQLFELN